MLGAAFSFYRSLFSWLSWLASWLLTPLTPTTPFMQPAPPKPPKPLLILDLNKVLIYRAYAEDWLSSAKPPPPAGATLEGKFYTWRRGRLDEFIEAILADYTVAVWSSARRENVNLLCTLVFKKRRGELLFEWDQVSRVRAVWLVLLTHRVRNPDPLHRGEAAPRSSHHDTFALPQGRRQGVDGVSGIQRREHPHCRRLLLQDGREPATLCAVRDPVDDARGHGGHVRQLTASNLQSFALTNTQLTWSRRRACRAWMTLKKDQNHRRLRC